MQAASFGMSWMLMLLLSGVGALPFGGAPLPLDAKLSNIAPPECLWYAAYSGQGPASAESGNQTEQLFAEPQVQRFAQEIESQIIRAVRRAGGSDRRQRVVAEEAPKLVKILLTSPSAMYIEDVQVGPGGDKRVDVSAAFVLNAGDRRQEMERSIEALLALSPPEAPRPTSEDVAGVTWMRAPTPPDAPAIRFGWKDAYFIVAVGEETPQRLIERMEGDAPKWLAELREEHPIEREISVVYLNVAGALERIRPIVESEDPQAWPALEKLGLTNVSAIHAAAGYDETGHASQVHLVTKDGRRPGLWSLLPHKRLEPGDLAPIPKDALVALAARIDASETFDNFVKLAAQFDPRAQDQVDETLWRINTDLGIDVREDILAPLGDAWTAYVPSGDLLFSWLNAAAAVEVDDAPRLQKSVRKLVDVAKMQLAMHRADASISETVVDGRTLFTLQFTKPTPVAPTWCVGESWLVAGLSPQAVRGALDRQQKESLAEAEAVSTVLEGEGAAALAYQDTPRLVQSLYPMITVGLQMASGELRRQGVEFDLSAIPTQDAIVKHLRPSVATLSHEENGFHLDSRSSLPGGGNVVAAAPIGVALLLPAVQAARDAARRAQDMNSMKQIGLAMHMYYDAHKRFPTDIYSDEGKPLLSWRVELLPYLEEQALYAQIKRDEPWDSEHNRQLLASMPAVFKSERGDTEPGKTRIQALKGPDGIMTGEEGVTMNTITDGTSNTLMFVQTAPEKGVEWTRPADVKFDEEKPFAAVSNPQGAFLGAMCDGSVRTISLGVGEDMMRRLANRHDDQVIDYDALTVPPAPHLHKAGGEEAAAEAPR